MAFMKWAIDVPQEPLQWDAKTWVIAKPQKRLCSDCSL